MEAFQNSIYSARRHRLIEKICHEGGGIVILPTAPETIRNRDGHFPYRHDSYFYYLTGFTEPNALLVIDTYNKKSILFCQPKNQEREIWDGFRYGPEAAKEIFGFDQTESIKTLDQKLPELITNAHTLYYPLANTEALDRQMRVWLETVRSKSRTGAQVPACLRDIAHKLDDMRLIKDAYEIKIVVQCKHVNQAYMNTNLKQNFCMNFVGMARKAWLITASWQQEKMLVCCITVLAILFAKTVIFV